LIVHFLSLSFLFNDSQKVYGRRVLFQCDWRFITVFSVDLIGF
jgi:hypothetical protein